MIHQQTTASTKFEVANSTHYDDMKMDIHVENGMALVVRVTENSVIQ